MKQVYAGVGVDVKRRQAGSKIRVGNGTNKRLTEGCPRREMASPLIREVDRSPLKPGERTAYTAETKTASCSIRERQRPIIMLVLPAAALERWRQEHAEVVDA